MAVRVVTDSTCDLPAAIVAALEIRVVPLIVAFGDEVLQDGVDIDSETFFARLAASGSIPKTSQPSVETFRATYVEVGAESHDIVSIHLSSRLSGTLNSASIAREDVERDIHIELIDSYNVSMGLGAIVQEAAEAAKRGASMDEVTAVTRSAMDRVHFAATLDTLEYLFKGGRIGRAKSLFGSLLSIKPILHMEDGELSPFDRVRTRTKAVARLQEIALDHQRAKRMYVACSGNDAEALSLIARIRPQMPHTEFILGHFGPVVGTYAGPNALGICWVDRE
ncbi:hypothetical protein AYO38_05045 [bacterium SCGC AG-212-C10]|nr:hypothetical protein AYO38_05045 [bacterium SCGC AG-212-C10]